MKKIKNFFASREQFDANEWLLKYQIHAIVLISFFFGIGVFFFAFVRLSERNILVGLSQLILGAFLLFGFYILRHNKHYYHTYSLYFMILFFLYTAIIFFNVPQNHLNILWVISAPIMIFFFLNRAAGVVMFSTISLFILYLVLTQYPYTIAEYITLLASFFITSFIMLTYEKVKDREREQLVLYTQKLSDEVAQKTKALRELNQTLERRITEETNKRMAQEQMLLRQCKLASMGEMIDAIAHQWRQPLMSINAILLNMDRSLGTRETEQIHFSEKINALSDLTEHMSCTIEDFRYLFRQEKDLTFFDLSTLAKQAVLVMKAHLKDIEICMDFQNCEQIQGYRNELFQVLISLLSNAAEALKSTGVEDAIIWISGRRDGSYALLIVHDNAGGIPKKHIDKIFDPYYTTKAKNGGSGLGLYISKIIIENNMKGILKAENVNHGAQFTIRLSGQTS